MDQSQITANAIQCWLQEKGPKSGKRQIPSRELYETFLESDFAHQLLIVPSLKKFTIELSKHLPKTKTASGTMFFCEVQNENHIK